MSTEPDFRFPNRPIYPPAVSFGPCEHPDLHDRERVVTHAPMKRFNITKDKLRDFGLVAVLLAGLALWAHDKDQEAVAKGDYWACHTDSCRQQVKDDALPASDGIPDIKH